MNTINIYHDNKLEKTFTGDNADTSAFGWMLRNQGQSVAWAIKYGGWKVEEVAHDGTKTYWTSTYDKLKS